MRVGILGPLEVMTGDHVARIGGARVRTLLIRLALDPERVVTTESLAGALWPESAPADPAHALQALVSRLRRALPDGRFIRSAPGGYCLDLPPDAVDALRFERLARDGRRELRAGRPDVAAGRLRDALDLWRGEALTDVAQVPFARVAAVRLDELRLGATEDRVAADLEVARVGPGLVAELEELTAAYPLRERLRGLLMRALRFSGRNAEALASYEEFRGVLADELGTGPGPELRAQHLALLRDGHGPHGHGPHGADGARRGNLRVPLTSFVGRAPETRQVIGQLARGRLVTLVGPGGVGKTRLATTVAGEHAGTAWLVELAPVSDPDDLPQTVAHALGLRETGLLDPSGTPRNTVGRIVEALAGAETLIVLDNCEHLLDASARLAEDLLGRCPGLRILATSREPLGIAGEALCPVPPLALPEPGVSVEDAMGSPAVRLLADRAAAACPGFAITEDTLAPTTEICRRLDGLPLALELAAARLRTLPVEELAARLGDRFRLLTGGSRTALPRHRTLHAVVAWSWDLLDAAERRVAERLAVFPATISPAAAACVCALPAPVSLDMLSALVDKSLIHLVPGPEPRYRMLETIREYGLERLAGTGETTAARAAHAAYFLQVAERAAPLLRGHDQLPAIRMLTAERDNMVAALHFSAGTGDAETAVRLAAALGVFWTIRGDHAEAASRLRLALEVPDAVAVAPAERMVVTAFSLFNTVLSGGGGDLAQGLAAIDGLPHPDPWIRAMLLLMRATLAGGDGGVGAMRPDLERAITAFRETGERWGQAHALTYLAYARITLGDFGEAIAGLEESIRLLTELDDGAVFQRVLLALAHTQGGDAVRAREGLLGVVAPDAASPSGYLVHARISLGDLARYDGDLEGAARHYAAAADDLRRVPLDARPFRAMLAAAYGHLATSRGELDAARRHLGEALALAAQAHDPPLEAGVCVAVARLRSREGTARGAAELLGAAHALRGAPDAFNRDVVSLVEELRGALGERAYDAAYDAGRGLDRTATLALAGDFSDTPSSETP
jgi:predicted ATPase/DNA-binding SARP family transcriptional activator